jgi:hypothetical protein
MPEYPCPCKLLLMPSRAASTFHNPLTLKWQNPEIGTSFLKNTNFYPCIEQMFLRKVLFQTGNNIVDYFIF